MFYELSETFSNKVGLDGLVENTDDTRRVIFEAKYLYLPPALAVCSNDFIDFICEKCMDISEVQK